MNLKHEIADAIRVGLFNKKVIHRVSKDKNATNLAFILFFLATFLAPFLTSIDLGEIGLNYFTYIVLILLSNVAIFVLIHLLSKLFGSKTSFISFLRPIGYFHIFEIVFLIGDFSLQGIRYIHSIWGVITTIWIALMIFVIMKEVYKFSMWRTISLFITTFLIGIGIMIVFFVIIILGSPEISDKILALSV